MAIILNNYNRLLENIKNCINNAEQKIVKIIINEKVATAWQIGKMINEHFAELEENDKSKYGENLFAKLQEDSGINQRILYKMFNFYTAYPKFPNNKNIDWSHYQILSTVDDAEKRKYLENFIVENNVNVKELEREAKKAKFGDTISAVETIHELSLQQQNNTPVKKLTPSRGKLWIYKLKKFDFVETHCNASLRLDCGFDIFLDIASGVETIHELSLRQQQEDGIIVEAVKNGSEYSFKKSEVKHQNTNIYKAYIEKVVDGDTVVVILDLGFVIFHKEILRLKGIDAPEMKTDEGKASKAALEEILEGVEFVIIKTIKTDIYGRYVADVFFNQLIVVFSDVETPNSGVSTNVDPQSIADNGEYLNQILLDRGLAKRLVM